jgi:predicted RNase H-like HicB family nuclease
MRADSERLPHRRWLGKLYPRYTHSMRNEFTAVIERDGDWFVAWSPEIPGANGQGHSVAECHENLGAAIQLILEDRNSDLSISY